MDDCRLCPPRRGRQQGRHLVVRRRVIRGDGTTTSGRRRARTGALAVDLDEWREAIDKGGSVQGGPITQAKDATNGAEQGGGGGSAVGNGAGKGWPVEGSGLGVSERDQSGEEKRETTDSGL